MRRIDHTPKVFTIQDFLSAVECREQIDRAETVGFADAPITTRVGPVMAPDIRNNTRVMIDDVELADRLWRRAAPLMPTSWGEWPTIGLNERFRYYRYDPGQKFAQHYDGRFRRSDAEQSRLTFMIYLNDGFVGGETLFWLDVGGDEPDLTIAPRAGAALVFEHRLLHEGGELVSGRKYVIRSDVMCRDPQAHNASAE